MARHLTLSGGRYDGFAFEGDEDGWMPGPSEVALALSRPAPEKVAKAKRQRPKGSVETTTLVAVPYRAFRESSTKDFRPEEEVYWRCADGGYRVSSLAATYC